MVDVRLSPVSGVKHRVLLRVDRDDALLLVVRPLQALSLD
jgi:hypothetical protein